MTIRASAWAKAASGTWAAALAAVLLLGLARTAWADAVVFERNDFYHANAGRCEPLGEEFYANSPRGWVGIRQAPGSIRLVEHCLNGDVLLIEATYSHLGRPWGAVAWGHGLVIGWVRMDELAKRPSYQDFLAEHSGELHPYEGDYALPEDVSGLALYTWPRSGELVEPWDVWFGDAPRLAYRDGQGLEWLSVGQAYTYRDTLAWLCLDGPEDMAIPGQAPFMVELHPARRPNLLELSLPQVLAAVAVAAVAVGSGLLLRRMRRVPRQQAG